MTTPPTSSVVCTLFENGYHFGVAGLVNSLYRHGWRGILLAGVRGSLPPWAQPLKSVEGFQEWSPVAGINIRFIPISTSQHLTYYKPQFMLDVLEKLAPAASAVVYFDPDIVIKAPWKFFEHWVQNHIALCEDLNWSFPHNHPIRREWARVFAPAGILGSGNLDVYYNAGFVGVAREHRGFLSKWLDLQQIIAPLIDNCAQMTVADRSFPFHKGDQDAMNAAVGLFSEQLSTVGPEGMDFIHGGYIMSHAVGNPKPWEKAFIASALAGRAPSTADKAFIASADGPVVCYNGLQLLWKRIELKTGSAIGRFIRRL